MEDNTNTDDGGEQQQITLTGEPADGEMTDREMREQLAEAVREHDGVFLVAGSLEVDDDGDEGVSLTVARFVSDDVDDDDDKAALMAQISKEAMENAVPGGKAHAVPMPMGSDEMPDELAELLGRLTGEGGPFEADADEADGSDADRMFQ